MSSDFGEPNEPTDPNDIPANVTIEVGELDGTNAGDELRITIDNTLSTYDVSEFWLNYSSDVASVDSLLSFPDLDGGWDLQGSTSVDGFGTFAFGATVDGGVAGVGATVDLVENGTSEVFLLALAARHAGARHPAARGHRPAGGGEVATALIGAGPRPRRSIQNAPDRSGAFLRLRPLQFGGRARRAGELETGSR
jgi:hypothetical protein